MSRRLVVVVVVVLGGMAAAAQALAATVLAMDLSQLVRSSDYVVVAKAESQSSRYRKGDSGLIVTDVRLRVLRALKGPVKAGEPLVATHLGGSVGRLGLRVPGEAAFTLGESAVVFLRALASRELQVVGMSQGVLPIRGDGAQAVVTPGGSGAALVHRTDDGQLRPAPDALVHERSLPEVLTELAQIVAAQAHAR